MRIVWGFEDARNREDLSRRRRTRQWQCSCCAVVSFELWRKELVSRVHLWRWDFMCNTWSVWLSETVIVSVLRSIARRLLVETENPNACATVNSKVFKSAIALYCLYLSVIKRECVTEVLINSIIRSRTVHFRRMCHPTHDNIMLVMTSCSM
jgi:hypothetical protein